MTAKFHWHQWIFIALVPLALGGCDLGGDDDDEITDVKSNIIDLAGADEPAELDTTDKALNTAGAVLAIAEKLGLALTTTSDAAEDGSESKRLRAKIERRENCSSGERVIDVSATSVARGEPEVDVRFFDCQEDGLTFNGLARLRCDDRECRGGKAIFGRDFEELRVDIGSSGVLVLFAGVGDYFISSRNPLNASLGANLKSQASRGDDNVNFQVGGGGGPLAVSVAEGSNFTSLTLDGFIGIGVSNPNSQCGGGGFDIATDQALQVASNGQVQGGELTVSTSAENSAALAFSSDGVTVTLAGETEGTFFTQEELAARCPL